MSDQPPTWDEKRAPAPVSIKNTAVVAGSGGIVLLVADWISDSIDSGHFVHPSKGLIVMALTLVAPTIHLVCRIIMKRLARLEEDSNQCHP